MHVISFQQGLIRMLMHAISSWRIARWHSSSVSGIFVDHCVHDLALLMSHLVQFIMGCSHSSMMVLDPDKWKSDSDHGMSRKEAENRFKSIQSAYDHLMSNFDD